MKSLKSTLAIIWSMSLGLTLVLFALGMPTITLAQDDTEAETPENGDSISLALPDVAYQATNDNGYCLICHKPDTMPTTDITWQDITQHTDLGEVSALIHSAHFTQDDITCLDCHPADTFPHIPQTQVADGWTQASDIADTCIGCHSERAEQIEGGCNDCHNADYTLPRDAAVLNVAVSECEACHAPTVQEWRMSAHGEQVLGCDSCHYAHQNELRFETAEALCLNCHEQARTGYTHVIHVEQSCESCHVYREFNQATHALSGGYVMGTGHDNIVRTAVCIDCHSDDETIAAVQAEAEEGDEVLPTEHPVLTYRAEVERLESEIENSRQEGGDVAAVRLIQSLIVGLMVGIVGTGTAVRFYRYSRNDDEKDEV